MAMSVGGSDDEPMMDMNTTPLIDVMLVLLIMLIITIPVQTHAVKFDIPTCANCPQPKATSNEVAILRSGAILWNGVDVGESGLRYELALTIDTKMVAGREGAAHCRSARSHQPNRVREYPGWPPRLSYLHQ